jgi:hypothetical protein
LEECQFVFRLLMSCRGIYTTAMARLGVRPLPCIDEFRNQRKGLKVEARFVFGAPNGMMGFEFELVSACQPVTGTARAQ